MAIVFTSGTTALPKGAVFGGRQLDFSAAPLRVLPGIAAEAKGLTVMMDGGIRRGTDVLKALALGAQFVFVGRPILYATAIGGALGLKHAIKLLREEVSRDMALLGINRLDEMTRDLLMPVRSFDGWPCAPAASQCVGEA